MKITVTDDKGIPVDESKGLFCSQTNKQYWILLGLITINSNLVCDGPNLESEVESQSEQLFQFIYNQIPCSVAKRLSKKLNENPFTKQINLR